MATIPLPVEVREASADFVFVNQFVSKVITRIAAALMTNLQELA